MSGGETLGRVRAIICEDEPLAMRAMREYLSEVEWIEIVEVASDGGSALRVISKHEPDLVFLDIRMPGMSGIEVLDALDDKPAVVFTTAFDEYAISAFELGAVDYLVKPFGRERLLQTLDRVRVRLVGEARARGNREGTDGARTRWASRLFARHRGGMVPVAVADILHIDAVSGGVALHLPGREYSLDSTLGELEERLDPQDFLRVHRAHLVNLARVRSIRRYDERRFILTLENDSTIVASRSGSQLLREMME